jgi:hypothetical protein
MMNPVLRGMRDTSIGIVMIALSASAVTIGSIKAVELYKEPSTTATAMAERAKMLKLSVPDIQKQYQSVMLEVGDSYVTIRTYCYQGTMIFTNIKGEPFGVSNGACKWKSH